MKRFSLSLLATFSLLSLAYADERTVLFNGLDAEIVSSVDTMTDIKTQGIVWDIPGPLGITIYGHGHFIIWPSADDLRFSSTDTHLIRVGKNRPYSLKLSGLSRTPTLLPTNTSEAGDVILALARGEEIKIRYYTWPKRKKVDGKIQHPAFGFIYNKAVNSFGWKDIGVSSELPPAKIHVYLSKEYDGYARVSVVSNDLALAKGFDKHGGETVIQIGVKDGFGLCQGSWVSGSRNFSGDNHYMIIYDAHGDIVFRERLPSFGARTKCTSPTLWDHGETAAKKAWEHAPLGSIEIEDDKYGKKVMLYGFKELWKWGIANAGLPPLE